MIFYFAGGENDAYEKVLTSAGIRSRLYNAYFLGYKKLGSCADKFERVLIDSGGVQARNHGWEVKLEDYIAFINRHHVKLAFNLDVRELEQSRRHQEALEGATSAYIIPIYHLSDFLNPAWKGYIHELANKYPYIGLGGVALVGAQKEQMHRFYSYVFSLTRDKVKVHGLGVSNTKLLEQYPFYSADSTSWLVNARYGRSKVLDGSRNNPLQKMRARTEHFTTRTTRELQHFLELERYYTELWRRRGITWE